MCCVFQSSVLYIVFAVCCILYTVSCALQAVLCVLCTIYRVLYSVHCALCSVYCKLYTVYCVLYAVPSALHPVQCVLCMVYCVPCAVNCAIRAVQCTVDCILYAVYCIMTIALNDLRIGHDKKAGVGGQDPPGTKNCKRGSDLARGGPLLLARQGYSKRHHSQTLALSTRLPPTVCTQPSPELFPRVGRSR